MKILKKFSEKNFFENYLEFGNLIFLIGIFFLPSALPLGAIFLLISIFISLTRNEENLLKNNFNLSFFICLLIIIASTIFNSLINPLDEFLDSQKSIIWINLFNWIPIYFAFLGFQIYLKKERQRLLFQKFLIAGTIPVLASCFMHRFLNIYGPLKTLFGTIVWFNYESVLDIDLLGGFSGGVSGLFNNPNYTGMWLTLCLPFSLCLLLSEKINKNKLFLLILNLIFIFFILSTNSRNAFLGLLIGLTLTFGIRKFIYFSFFIIFGYFIFDFIMPDFLNLNENYLLNKLTDIDFNFNSPRINIWVKAINLITQKPIFGWGAGSSPFINTFLPPFQNYQHTHNMIIELAHNFGIPLAILVFSLIIRLLQKSFQKLISLKKSYLNYISCKSFIISFSIFLIAHLNDITYYDGKISILFSVLLASLVQIIGQENDTEMKEY